MLAFVLVFHFFAYCLAATGKIIVTKHCGQSAILSQYNQDSIDDIIRNGNMDNWNVFRQSQSFTLCDYFNDGHTILQKAVSHGRGELCIALLEEQPEIIHQKNDIPESSSNVVAGTETCHPGDTALHVAFRAGQIAIAQLLINEGADRNAKNHKGSTPLHAWAASDYFEGLRVTTVEEGLINGHITDLNVMHTSERVFISKFLSGASVEEENNDSKERPIHIAAARGHSSIVKTLLMVNADLAAKDVNGNEPLHLAAKGGHCKTIIILLQCGAYLKAVTNEGLTPMDIAIQNNRLAARDILEREQGRSSPSFTRTGTLFSIAEEDDVDIHDDDEINNIVDTDFHADGGTISGLLEEEEVKNDEEED